MFPTQEWIHQSGHGAETQTSQLGNLLQIKANTNPLSLIERHIWD